MDVSRDFHILSACSLASNLIDPCFSIKNINYLKNRFFFKFP
ncbi:MAG: hypothetical protein JWM42_1354 [Burkholderia sp.]|nr:hypothetical protein [Burkholderia sp.]